MKRHTEDKKFNGSWLRDCILGGQDGLVNVLGIILGVAGATGDAVTVIIAGIAATFAESISMAAVGYTSIRASQDYYYSELEREKREMKEVPEAEKKEIHDIFRKRGFRGRLLDNIVKHITSNKKLWLDTMMRDELDLSLTDISNPLKSAAVIGFSAIIGSIIPLIPFFFLTVGQSIIATLIIAAITLYIAGYAKAKLTIGKPLYAGFELMMIGMLAAVSGYGVGIFMGWIFGTTVIG